MRQDSRINFYRMSVLVALLVMSSLVVWQTVPVSSAATVDADAVRANLKFDIKPPDLATLIAGVKPAVVSIVVEKRSVPAANYAPTPDFGGLNREWPFRFFGAPEARAPRPFQSRAEGSGFIIDQTGVIVSNYHVIENADEISVVFESGEHLPARLLGADERTDLAVLKVDAKDPLPFVEFGDSDAAAVGDWVVAIGNPFGFGGTATAGIISARGRDLQSGPYIDFIQIDASINSGNSGGPVFDETGRVIGVSTAIYSPNGGNVGLGFAIPASDAQLIVADLQNKGAVARGWLGVQIQDINDALADSLGLEKVAGALVADVVADSPAADAGVKVGDVIVAFDGSEVTDSKGLTRLVSRAKLGARTEMTVVRSGHQTTLKPRVRALQEQPNVAFTPPGDSDLGLRVAPLSEARKNQLGIDASVQGVVVVEIDPVGEAAREGIRRGDIISRINGDPIHSPGDLQRAVTDLRAKNRHQVAVLVQRGDSKRFVTLGLG